MADTHTASVDEANAARLPLGYRDQCSAYVPPNPHVHTWCQPNSNQEDGTDPLCHANSLLIPLNKCRKQTLYAPWKCEDER